MKGNDSMKYICTKCFKEEDINSLKMNCECGGLFKLDYKLEDFNLDRINKNEFSILRYENYLPVDKSILEEVSMGEGMTDIIRYKDVYLKMDYLMPTLSFKDRGASLLISHCKEIGVKKVVQDSSGNAGNSVAAYCARAGIGCEIFVPKATSEKKIKMIKSHGAKVTVVNGSRDMCADVCRNKAKNENIFYANHVYNPFFYEGTKTYIYEVYEKLGRIPENIVIPLGNGTLYLGIMIGLEHLYSSGLISHIPNIIAVQSENCDPLLKAFENNEKDYVDINIKDTLAEGIAIGKPMRAKEILEYASKYNIKFIHAKENMIEECRNELAQNGIFVEHTTSANYAGYLNYCEKYGKTEDVLIPMCGAGIKSEQ